MNERKSTNRRTVLKTIGAGVAAGTTISGTATARGNLVSKINRDGHWAYFPKGFPKWGRQKHPYDYREGASRWLAEPAAGGSVRALVNNIGGEGFEPNRNAGFDVHMGPLGDLDTITIESETVRTQADEEALLFVGLYLDKNGDGSFLNWTGERGNIEAFAGLGDGDGDEEGLYSIVAGGKSTIDNDTTFGLFATGGSKRFGDIKSGSVEGIDKKTQAALYIGVIDKEAGGAEEAIVKDVAF